MDRRIVSPVRPQKSGLVSALEKNHRCSTISASKYLFGFVNSFLHLFIDSYKTRIVFKNVSSINTRRVRVTWIRCDSDSAAFTCATIIRTRKMILRYNAYVGRRVTTFSYGCLYARTRTNWPTHAHTRTLVRRRVNGVVASPPSAVIF